MIECFGCDGYKCLEKSGKKVEIFSEKMKILILIK